MAYKRNPYRSLGDKYFLYEPPAGSSEDEFIVPNIVIGLIIFISGIALGAIIF